MDSERDSDDNSDTELKPKIEDILLLNETYNSNNQKEKKHYYGKKRYKNVKAITNVEITNVDMEKMIVDDLNGQYFPGYVKYFKSHYKDCLEKSMKSSQKSIEARIKGNELFTKTPHSVQIHKDILELYSKSIAFAPIGSKELVLAYECRSNLLLHWKQYLCCVKDIDRALDITEFVLLKVKLLCRKMTCFMAMQKSIDEKRKLWETLNNCFEKVDVAFKDGDFLKMIEQAKIDSQKQPTGSEKIEKDSKVLLEFENLKNLTMLFQKEIRIVANRDFAPGELVALQKPLVTSFNPNIFYAYCSHCLSAMKAGIPCDECSLCMYCSEECKKDAWNKYHIFECKILPHMNIENIIYNIMHLSVRVLLKGIRELGSISKLKEKMQEIDKLRDDSRLDNSLLESDFQQFYASLYTHINSSAYNLDEVSKLAMQACFLVVCMVQTCDIFENKNFKSFRGKELAKDQNIVNLGFVLLKILISNIRNISSTAPAYKADSKCDKYAKYTECSNNRHCTRGSYYDSLSAMFEKSCNPNVVKCWIDYGFILYYCIQPIKKMEKITIRSYYNFFINKKSARDKYAYFSIYCQCEACLKEWPIMEKLFEKTKQRRLKIETKESKIVQKYLERNQSTTKFVQEKNCVFNEEEYQQLLRDVEDVVKACGQPSFASSFMIYYLCIALEKKIGTQPLLSYIPAKC